MEWLCHTLIIISYIFTESKRFLINKRPLTAVKVHCSCGAGGERSQKDIEGRSFHRNNFRKCSVWSRSRGKHFELGRAQRKRLSSVWEGGSQLSFSFRRPFAVCRWWATAARHFPFGKLWAAVSQDRDTITCPLRRDRQHCSLLWVQSPAIESYQRL